jgi:hypothetical protein
MVLPLAALAPIGGAVLGGYEGYRRSGGDLGAAALAAGLGAAAPGALRMAGTALGATPMGAAALARGSQLLAKGAQFAKLPAPGPLTAAGLGAAAAGVGSLVAPQLAGGIAAAAAPAARTGAQTGAGAVGYQGPGAVNYEAAAGGAIPPNIGMFGAGGTLSDPLQVLGPVGMAQRLETLKTAEAQRDALRLMMPEIAKASEFRSRQEMQRQLAAAGVRQNILTAANMLERSQQAAQQMGVNAASQAGAALTSQYQYQ